MEPVQTVASVQDTIVLEPATNPHTHTHLDYCRGCELHSVKADDTCVGIVVDLCHAVFVPAAQVSVKEGDTWRLLADNDVVWDCVLDLYGLSRCRSTRLLPQRMVPPLNGRGQGGHCLAMRG